jgi:hypothetical protein
VILNKIHLIVGAKPKTKKPQKQKEAAIPLDTSDQNKSYSVNMGRVGNVKTFVAALCSMNIWAISELAKTFFLSDIGSDRN